MSLLDYIIAPIPLRQTFLVASRITIDGSFKCDGSGVIVGCINGDVAVQGKITLAKKGIINGNVKAANMIVKGTITGNVYCEGSIKVASSALIKGNIVTGEIDVEKNAVIEGSITKLTAKNIEEERNYFIESFRTTQLEENFVEEVQVAAPIPVAVHMAVVVEEAPKEKQPQTWF